MSNSLLKPLLKILKEPLFQFLVLGLLIFIVSDWLSQSRNTQQTEITIDEGLQSYLENLYSVQFGIYPDTETLERLIESYIREEVLFREGLKLGLAQQDEIIRRRLVQKMEFLIQDSEVQAEAGEGELEDYYVSHLDDYTQPARVSFQHIYFEGPEAFERASEQAASTRDDSDVDPSAGDRFPLSNAYSSLSEREARQLFGKSDFVDQLFVQSIDKWSGPFQSGYGWHLIYPERRSESAVLPLEEVKEEVFAAWQEQDKQERYEQVLESMIETYTINRTSRTPSNSVLSVEAE